MELGEKLIQVNELAEKYFQEHIAAMGDFMLSLVLTAFKHSKAKDTLGQSNG